MSVSGSGAARSERSAACVEVSEERVRGIERRGDGLLRVGCLGTVCVLAVASAVWRERITRVQGVHVHQVHATLRLSCCGSVELQHASVGNGSDRRLVVSRFKLFAAATAAQAQGACRLARVPTKALR